MPKDQSALSKNFDGSHPCDLYPCESEYFDFELELYKNKDTFLNKHFKSYPPLKDKIKDLISNFSTIKPTIAERIQHMDEVKNTSEFGDCRQKKLHKIPISIDVYGTYRDGRDVGKNPVYVTTENPTSVCKAKSGYTCDGEFSDCSEFKTVYEKDRLEKFYNFLLFKNYILELFQNDTKILKTIITHEFNFATNEILLKIMPIQKNINSLLMCFKLYHGIYDIRYNTKVKSKSKLPLGEMNNDYVKSFFAILSENLNPRDSTLFAKFSDQRDSHKFGDLQKKLKDYFKLIRESSKRVAQTLLSRRSSTNGSTKSQRVHRPSPLAVAHTAPTAEPTADPVADPVATPKIRSDVLGRKRTKNKNRKGKKASNLGRKASHKGDKKKKRKNASVKRNSFKK